MSSMSQAQTADPGMLKRDIHTYCYAIGTHAAWKTHSKENFLLRAVDKVYTENTINRRDPCKENVSVN